MKQVIKNGKLITTTEREIHTRSAMIIIADNGALTYSVYQDARPTSIYCSPWPPAETAVPPGWDALSRLREHLEICQFGGRVEIGWRKSGNQWVTDQMISDQSGYGFNEDELQLIRESRKTLNEIEKNIRRLTEERTK